MNDSYVLKVRTRPPLFQFFSVLLIILAVSCVTDVTTASNARRDVSFTEQVLFKSNFVTIDVVTGIVTISGKDTNKKTGEVVDINPRTYSADDFHYDLLRGHTVMLNITALNESAHIRVGYNGGTSLYTLSSDMLGIFLFFAREEE